MAEPRTFAQAWEILNGLWSNSEKLAALVRFLKEHAGSLSFDEEYQLRGALPGLMSESLLAVPRRKKGRRDAPVPVIPGLLSV
ncbi:hypothetical protein [Deinococcus knuensis]|uniref:Uncharacterized protein n=1 Tax=Deinococcus knuensis TaxID=1837380 RepID=A0ABQ2SZ86_9DEIO|nr:hypothetical protein [Deinococcus knuensis]GGS44811.1 hypothetical protein GCM10008961_39370 [Deinococcus knuensis]